jgi:CubicO group peptidase (beta-lactamase class C family)
MICRLVFSFLLFSSFVFSQNASLPPEVVKSIEQRVQYGTNPSIVIGIIDQNGPTYYSFGSKKIDGPAADEHTIYEIGSISKVFTATLLANNIIKGKMKADDPIEEYLPAFVKVPTYEGAHITLGNLSDHTSSLPRLPSNMPSADPSNPYADYTVDMMYSFLSTCELTRPIGSEYEYSNLAVGLLGHILALDAKSSYEELLTKVITTPLKMTETGITLNAKMKANMATGTTMGMEVENWDIPTLAGAGAIRSSVSDMLLFLSANMGITKSPLKEAMELAQTQRHDKANGIAVGLGWHITKGAVGNVIWHNGGTGGFRTFIGFVKETGKGVAIFTNSTESVDDIGFYLLQPDAKLAAIKPQIAGVLRKIIDSEGIDSLYEKYQAYKTKSPDVFDFDEVTTNALGYYYLSKNRTDAALALLEINVKEFPASFNAYDSYGEALFQNGQQDEAIKNYRRSLVLNPGNINAVNMLAKMGVEMPSLEVAVDETILQSYTGVYELVPGVNIEITRDGKQLFGQATGQSKFEIFARSNTDFFLKVVDAQIQFNTDAEGKVRLTLYQSGQVMEGKRL